MDKKRSTTYCADKSVLTLVHIKRVSDQIIAEIDDHWRTKLKKKCCNFGGVYLVAEPEFWFMGVKIKK